MTELIVMYILPNIALFGGIYLFSKVLERLTEITIDHTSQKENF